MKATRPQKVLTVEEFERMPKEDAYRLELVRGLVVREPRPGGRHAFVNARVIMVLGRWAEESGAGFVYARVGVVTSAEPATVRGPDVAYWSRGRAADPWPDGFFRVGPDLAVEILSPSNRRREILRKAEEYFRVGTRAVWIVDPRRRTVETLRPGSAPELFTAEAVVPGGEVLPGFSVVVRNLLGLPF